MQTGKEAREGVGEGEKKGAGNEARTGEPSPPPNLPMITLLQKTGQKRQGLIWWSVQRNPGAIKNYKDRERGG